MKNEKIKKPVELKDVDFSSFRVKRKNITVNGKELPISIGDRILMEEDGPVKTCMGVLIQEDGRVSYALEWYDPATGGFSTEQLTLMELKLLGMNQQRPKKEKKKAVGFGQEESEEA